MTRIFSGTFQITQWNEEAISNQDEVAIDGRNQDEATLAGRKQTVAKITQEYMGDLVGTSSLQYVMTYQSEQLALFVGFEQLNVTINGKSGTLVVKHDGTFENGVASSKFVLIPSSGTGGFTNVAGQGTFKSTENGQAKYSLELS